MTKMMKIKMTKKHTFSGRTMEEVEVDKNDQYDEDQDDINHTLFGRTIEDVEEEAPELEQPASSGMLTGGILDDVQ